MPADWSIDLMHQFNPTYASPRMKSHPKPSPSTCTDLSQSVNGVVAPELQNLSKVDLDILETVIKRAGPKATTFFTVFKAYSDVLKERGLDPQEVVYYGKLLKVGTLKGKDWGEKWAAVKAQNTRVSKYLSSTHRNSRFPPARTRYIHSHCGEFRV